MTGTDTSPKAAIHAPGDTGSVPPRVAVAGPTSVKVQRQHLERLAVVYIRQSSPRQVQENRESRARQYALADYATALGWPSERVLVIDDDQGQSSQQPSEDRLGFQRLVAEVTMDHVGIILGLEMSRLGRRDSEWHRLLELCGVFGTLLADQDGIYDAADPNDRLLLGLKGTISSVELHTMRNRLEKGKLFKAQRGDLFMAVPIGYVRLPSGEVTLDPDEQVRAVVALIFAKFAELGAVRRVYRYLLQHDIRIGVRPQDGPNRGQVEWRRPCLPTLYGMLGHPIYAGAYAYGRCPVDPKRRHAGRSKSGRRWVPRNQWKVLIRDHLPAYITWEEYLENQERRRQNRTRWEVPGTPRKGAALLGGLVFCGRCGTRMIVYYNTGDIPRYDCGRHYRHGVERSCHGLRGSVVDDLVAQQVLRALEPAALELSLRAADDAQRERERLALHSKQQVERSRYDALKAERHYRAVDPENRLVARTLEHQWEEALCRQRQAEEEYDRFLRQMPTQLTAEERARIEALATDIRALWDAPTTTTADRKEVVRALVQRVDVCVQGNTEVVDVTVHWAGGFVSQHQVRRPVAGYSQLRDYDRLLARLRELHGEGLTAPEVAEQLNREGFHPSGRRDTFTADAVRLLLSRWGLSGWRAEQVPLGPDEWWLSDLARCLGVRVGHLRKWENHGWVHGRRTSSRLRWRILWADKDELARLRQMADYAKAHPFSQYPAGLTTPKRRPGRAGRKTKG